MNVLNRLLEISVYSVILFLAVMAIKKAFHYKMSPVMHFAVWFLLVARLCVPVTIDSEFRLIVIPAQASNTAIAITEKPSTEFPTALTSVEPQLSTNTQNSIQPQQKAAAIQPQTPSNASAILQSADKGTWADWLVAAWLAGVFVSAAWLVFTLRRMNRMIKQHGTKPPLRVLQIMAACKNDYGIHKNIPVWLMPKLSTPALTMGLRPKLILPADITDTLNEKQLEFAIMHELTHYKRSDHLTGLLLRLLQAVYWFNPVVWLMSKYMIADMETACDSMVLKSLDQQEKRQYVLTLLDMFSGRKAPQYLLGMALSHTERIAEKRIRGAFMNCKSKRGTKLMAGVLAIILFVGCFTTACQPTPEKPVVVNKADGLGSLIEATPGASSAASPSNTAQPNNDALYEKLAAPKHWTFKEKALDGKLNLKADVYIEIPNVSQLPAATAALSEFTQEDLDKIAKVLGAEDCVWTEIDHTMTKAQIEQGILDYKARRAEYKAEGNDELVKHMDENIEAYEQMYEDAPSESELKNIDFKISQLTPDGDDTFGIGFMGITQVDGKAFFFLTDNSYSGEHINRISANFGTGPNGFGGVDIDKPFCVSLTKEQAAEQASEIAAQLTDELTLCYITPAASRGDESRNWGWACVFMREINGCPTAYETTVIGSSLEAVNVPVDYEKMIIVMDDEGMVCFEWEVPMTIESIDNSDVSLLSFDEISQRAIEQIEQRLADTVSVDIDSSGIDWGDPGCTANIVSVKLGLMRVAKANSNEFYYIPVWKFFVDLEHTDEYYERTGTEPPGDDDYVDEDGTPLEINSEYSLGSGLNVITINALDGSNIDSNLGY